MQFNFCGTDTGDFVHEHINKIFHTLLSYIRLQK